MSRYEKTKTNQFFNYKTSIYKKVQEKDTDMYFVTQPGDRLDILAHRFYGDAKLWWFLARVNNLNSINVDPGISIRVPITTVDAKVF